MSSTEPPLFPESAGLEVWYYFQQGQQRGPKTVEHMRSLAASGELRPDDLVWKAGMAEWMPARTQSEIFAGIHPPVRSPEFDPPGRPVIFAAEPTADDPLADFVKLVKSYVRRAFGWNLQQIHLEESERQALSQRGIDDATLGRYFVWRQAMLWVIVLPALLGAILHSISIFTHEIFPRNGLGWFIDVVRMLTVYAVGVAAAVAAFFWTDYQRSHRILFWSGLVVFAVPILAALIPIDWMSQDVTGGGTAEERKAARFSLGFAAGIIYYFTLLPTVIALIPGFLRACLRIKALLPASIVTGWLMLGTIPLYVLIWLVAMIALNQFVGNLLLIVGFVFLFGAPAVYFVKATVFVRPLTTAEESQVMVQSQLLFIASVAVGSLFLVVWLFSKEIMGKTLMGFNSETSLMQPWNSGLFRLWLEYISKSFFMTVVFADLLLRMNYSIWHEERRFAATEKSRDHEETLERIGRVLQAPKTAGNGFGR